MSVCRDSRGSRDGKESTCKANGLKTVVTYKIPPMPERSDFVRMVNNDIYWVGERADDTDPVLARLHPEFDLEERFHQVLCPPRQLRKGDIIYLYRHDERSLQLVLSNTKLAQVYLVEVVPFEGKKRIKYVYLHGGSIVHPFWINSDLPRDGITLIVTPKKKKKKKMDLFGCSGALDKDIRLG